MSGIRAFAIVAAMGLIVASGVVPALADDVARTADEAVAKEVVVSANDTPERARAPEALVVAPATAGTNACLTAITVPSPVTVSVSPTTGSLQAGSGTTQSFSATVGYTLNTQVTWQVNTVAGGNATVGTISNAGLYTAPGTVPSPATVTVTAVSVADSTRSASATVTITAPPGSSGGGGGGAMDWATLLASVLLSASAALRCLSPRRR